MVRHTEQLADPPPPESPAAEAGRGGLLHRPLPMPPDSLRRGPLRTDAWRSTLRSERTAALLGVAVGVAFGVSFITGLISHYAQNTPDWLLWPSRPVNLYRFTQGLHVVTGFSTIPLLLAKLWTVYPKLFEWPPMRSIAHIVGRLSLLVLVGAGLFQLVSGVINVARWYAVLPFFFTVTHYWTAWIIIGAILVHVGSKLPVIRRGLARTPVAAAPAAAAAVSAAPDSTREESAPAAPDSNPAPSDPGPRDPAPQDPAARDPAPPEPVVRHPVGALSRRGFLTAVAATSGVVALTTAGQTLPLLSAITVFGQRDPDLGPQGLPVNKSAASAGVLETATDPTYQLVLDGPRPAQLSMAVLRSMPQTTVSLPITCVEGWSSSAEWTGIRIVDLLAMMGLPSDAELSIESLQDGGLYSVSTLTPPHSTDPLTLLALRLNGQELDIDHGYPVRLIAPNRPGVLQTKWVSRVRAL